MKRSGMLRKCEAWGLFQHLVLPTELLLVKRNMLMKRSGMLVTCEVWGLFQYLAFPTDLLLVQKIYVDEAVWHVSDM